MALKYYCHFVTIYDCNCPFSNRFGYDPAILDHSSALENRMVAQHHHCPLEPSTGRMYPGSAGFARDPPEAVLLAVIAVFPRSQSAAYDPACQKYGKVTQQN